MSTLPSLTMRELLEHYPGAQRALFRHFHIGGCSSCGFQPQETLAEVCARNEGLDPIESAARIIEAHEQDELVFIEPVDAAAAVNDAGARLLDVRTREEFEAVHIPGSLLFSQDLIQQIMSNWPKETILILVDHKGTRSLDAAAYFAGHGFAKTRALRGGIDAWSCAVDPNLPRYTTE
jgi:rhodanese-related sulfurtransferase